MSAQNLPVVSIVMPVLNEERHLAHAVERILDQDYTGDLEVVLAVGPSRDRTRELADSLAREHDQVRVVDNPTGKTPAGLNAAIAAARGEIIIRVDGHAMIPSDYVRIGVRTLSETGADNVGGIMAAEGTTDFEQAVARAMTSRFGVGGASFHLGGQAGPALTVYLGCFRRSALERVNGYDESMERAQDWEMNLRIRLTGGLVWFTPSMRVAYRPRASVGALARQYFDYGRWRREVAARYPDTLSLRYLAAPVMVVCVTGGPLVCVAGGLAVSLAGAPIGTAWPVIVGLAPLAAYAAGNLLASIHSALASPQLSVRSAKWLPIAYATMHMAWGTGFLRGGATGRGRRGR